ncbi:MAG: molybdopterin-dependent oxidoreductase [Coriobacteriales bacterium]|nr:molybdopterin-dependent oxidoreductase [Coriobacteriales bacterium]
MSKLTMTRRSFLKVAAVTGAAMALSSATVAPTMASASNATLAPTGGVQRIRTCCRGCGKCECGVWVTVIDGKAIKVEGDEACLATMGNSCIKSQASMQALYHPDRLRYPMKRTQPKGASDPGWVRMTWDEAFSTVYNCLDPLVEKYGPSTFTRKSGTSRLWGNFGSKLSGLWDPQRGVSPYIGGVQVCKGPRQIVGRTTIKMAAHSTALSDYVRVYVQWGTDQCQSNYDNAGRTVNEVARRAKYFVSVDPRKTNNGKEADVHLPLRSGSDNEMALAWTRIVMEQELYDDLFVKRWTNAPFLFVQDMEPSGWIGVKLNRSKKMPVSTRLLKQSDIMVGGDPKKFMVWDSISDSLKYFDANEDPTTCDTCGMWEGQTEYDIPTTGWEYARGGWVPDPAPFPVEIDPALWGEYDVTLKDGRTVKAKPIFQKYWDECVSEWTLEKAEEYTGVNGADIEAACKLWATRIDPRVGNGPIDYNLGPEQEGNCWDNFRSLMILSTMCDGWDIPGGHRGITQLYTVGGNAGGMIKNTYGKTAGFPADPRSEMEKYEGYPGMEEFPLLKWTGSVYEDARSMYEAVITGDPIPMKAFVEFASGILQQSNSAFCYEAAQHFEFQMTLDLWMSTGAGIADVVLPAQHWMEIPGCTRQSQNATGNVGASCNCVPPIGDVKYDHEIVLGVFRAFGVPFYKADPDLGLTDPWCDDPDIYLNVPLKDIGVTWKEYYDSFQKEGWWDAKVLCPTWWGTYRRYLMGDERANESGLNRDGIQGFYLPTMKIEYWSTIAEVLVGDKAALPHATEPEVSIFSTPDLAKEYPITLTTGARISSYFHSEHRQLPWCREVAPSPKIYLNPEDAKKYGLEQGDWAWVESKDGKIRLIVDYNYGMRPGNANADHHWWFPELPQADRGFRLCNVNTLVDRYAQDWVLGSSEIRGYLVKVYKATPENSPFGNPVPCGDDGTEIIHDASDPRLKEWQAQIEDIANDPSHWEVYK